MLTKQFEAAQISPEEFAEAARRTLSAAFTDDQLWDAWNTLVTEFDPAHVATVRRLRKGERIEEVVGNLEIGN